MKIEEIRELDREHFTDAELEEIRAEAMEKLARLRRHESKGTVKSDERAIGQEIIEGLKEAVVYMKVSKWINIEKKRLTDEEIAELAREVETELARIDDDDAGERD